MYLGSFKNYNQPMRLFIGNSNGSSLGFLSLKRAQRTGFFLCGQSKISGLIHVFFRRQGIFKVLAYRNTNKDFPPAISSFVTLRLILQQQENCRKCDTLQYFLIITQPKKFQRCTKITEQTLYIVFVLYIDIAKIMSNKQPIRRNHSKYCR